MNNMSISENRMIHALSGYDRERIRREKNRRRKQIQIFKQRLAILIVSAALIIAAAIMCGSFLSDAKTSNDYHEYKYFTQYTVRSGETLWEIASVYADEHYDSLHDYIAEVKSMNHIKDTNEIKAGSVIMIPYYSEELK